MGDYRRLRVWQGAYALSLKVYRATERFPPAERFGLTSQLRRAATSIAINIAEGSGRGSDADSARFLRMARGSLHELTCEIMLATDLGHLSVTQRAELLSETDSVGSALVGLIRSQGALHTRNRVRAS